jgi:hypothetical protein
MLARTRLWVYSHLSRLQLTATDMVVLNMSLLAPCLAKEVSRTSRVAARPLEGEKDFKAMLRLGRMSRR